MKQIAQISAYRYIHIIDRIWEIFHRDGNKQPTIAKFKIREKEKHYYGFRMIC